VLYVTVLLFERPSDPNPANRASPAPDVTSEAASPPATLIVPPSQ